MNYADSFIVANVFTACALISEDKRATIICGVFAFCHLIVGIVWMTIE